MTDQDIVKAYDRVEEQCGGIANASPRYVVDRLYAHQLNANASPRYVVDRLYAHQLNANASPRYVVDRTAQELDVSVERVRRVMIDHWTMRGGG